MSHDPDLPGATGGEAGEDRIASILAIAQFIVTAVILGGVATLAYLAGMRTAAREPHAAGPAPQAQVAASSSDLQKLLAATPELAARGKTLYGINCASCHGPAGHGDGPAAPALNPKPRNFTEGYWRYGGGVARIAQTITVGSPGTAMAAFTAIPIEDRFALAHFIRSLGTTTQEDKPADLAWLGPTGGAPAAGGGAPAGGAPKPGPTIPIERALALLAVAPPAAGQGAVPAAADPPRGATLYAERCAGCHGRVGEGGVPVRMLGSAPYAYATTRSLGVPRTDWPAAPATFRDLVLRGLPGYLMPANGDLGRSDLEDLYRYVQRLHAQQQGAGHGRSS